MQFEYRSQRFVPVGFNAYWLGITEEQEYPQKQRVEEMFVAATQMGATVIRSHTLGMSSGASNSLRQPGNIVNENAWDAVDYAFSLARQYDIKLICPLLDAYYWYNGNYGDFSNDYGISKESFFTDRRCIDDFKEYITQWLNHRNTYTGIFIKDSPEIFAIETGNEFNIRPENNAFPPKDWLIEITEHIRSIDSVHMILHGTDEPLGQVDDFNIENLDIFTGHFYGEDYSRMQYGASNSQAKMKPYIIGEMSSKFEQNFYDSVEAMPNVLGTFVWSMYPHSDGTPNGERIPHEDGYTIWYDTQTSENTEYINRITNHFNAMRA
jgi:mannan endo-1,4-beta-mannosidase